MSRERDLNHIVNGLETVLRLAAWSSGSIVAQGAGSIPGAALLCSAATWSTHVSNLRNMLDMEKDSQHDASRWVNHHHAHGGWHWHSPL